VAATPDSDPTIFDWSRKYIGANYVLDGIADILPGGAQYVWGPAGAGVHAADQQPVDGVQAALNKIETRGAAVVSS
jgi:hypothetical protein